MDYHYTAQERAHLERLCASSHLLQVVTGDCWLSFMANAERENAPSLALEKWLNRCAELADECDCAFTGGEHL